MTIKCPQCQFENSDETTSCGKCAAPLKPSDDIPADHTKTIESPHAELRPGSTFAGRYKIIEELGKGGMGTVYRALDQKLNEEVALKLIKPEISSDEKTLERFHNELKLARKIGHRHVARMYELLEDNGRHFITMEYVSGEDLKSFLRRSKQLSLPTAISITKQICDGLAEAHRLGVVHRDLKPSNIMIDKEGDARIMDFGIARSLKTKGITRAGVMIGTPEYMSPEQAEGKDIDQRSDIYSLGIILYEMVTGQVPFEGETPLSIARKHADEVPQDPKEYNQQIPDGLNQVILKCLEKDKEQRYQDTDELQYALESIERRLTPAETSLPPKKPATPKVTKRQFQWKKVLIPSLIVLAVICAGIIIWQLLLQKEITPPEAENPSIAVLPFEDMSPHKDQGILCDGFAESIINALTQIQDLRVPARNSSFSFRGKERDLLDIGAKLSVATVLEGSLQKSGDRIRITAQLIKIADESILWSGQYDRNLDDVFTIQDEISLSIVDELKGELLGDERLILTKRYTENVEAYNLYLVGRSLWKQRAKEEMTKAIKYFEKAIEKDPDYALAYTGIADAYDMLGFYNFLPSKDAYPKAKEAVLKALAIDDTLAEAHTSLGRIKSDMDWDWEGATKEYMRALEINPRYATANHWYATNVCVRGRFDEAIARIERAQELDPLSPIISADLGLMHYYARQPDKALEQSQKALEMDRNFWKPYNTIGHVYLVKGMYSEAIAELQKSIELFSADYVYGALGFAYGKAGMGDKARQLLDKANEESRIKNISNWAMSLIYLGLGMKTEALDHLEMAYEKRDGILISIKIEPLLYELRQEPRFKALIKKMNLE